MVGDPDARTRAIRRAWSAGRYPSLAPNLLPATAHLVDAAGVDGEDAVLDVGCGTGNVAITAARRGASIMGVDIADDMVRFARSNAALAGDSDVAWSVADAGSLPVGDATFDVALSNFGHIFAPDVTAATEELLRAVGSGGRVAFTAWSPGGLVGDLAAVLGDHLDGDDSDPWSFLDWGDPSYVRERLGDGVDPTFQRRIASFRYVSPGHFWREFAEESGPLAPAIRGLHDPERRQHLRRAAIERLEDWFADNAVRVEYTLVRVVA
ncbi:MAG: class I SAM-dependent methyltransferase [Halobacteriales archaeon]